jgi:hypothetical protein
MGLITTGRIITEARHLAGSAAGDNCGAEADVTTLEALQAALDVGSGTLIPSVFDVAPGHWTALFVVRLPDGPEAWLVRFADDWKPGDGE